MTGKRGGSQIPEKCGLSGVISGRNVADHISGTGIFSKTKTQARAGRDFTHPARTVRFLISPILA